MRQTIPSFLLFFFIGLNLTYGQAVCDSTITDPGGLGDYENNTSVHFTYCADSGSVLKFDFTEINLAGSILTDYIRVYEGDSIPSDSSDYTYIIGEEAGAPVPLLGVWTMPTDSTFANVGNSFTSSGSCITLLFTSDTSNVGSGWSADITCIGGPTCSDGIQNGDETFVDCGGSCGTCPTPCEGFTFTDNGGANNLSLGSNNQYSMCADTPADHVIVDFSMIDMGSQLLFVYDGDSTNVTAEYIVTGGNVSKWNVNKYLVTTDSIQSAGQCFTFVLYPTDSLEQGWEANVSTTNPGICAAVLPVELVSFDGKVVDHHVELNWSTEVETNNEIFTVHKSLDGINYVEHGTVNSVAIGNVGGDYNYIDNSPSHGINYYQLSQTDFDGTTTIVGNTYAQMDAEDQQLTIFPNPTSGNRLTVRIPEVSQNGQIIVYDKLGRTIINQSLSDQSIDTNVDISNLLPGMYIIQTINGDTRTSSKFIKAIR